MDKLRQDVLMELLANAIATRRRGDDAYRRWPLDLLVALQRRIKQLEAENAKLRTASARLVELDDMPTTAQMEQDGIDQARKALAAAQENDG